MKIEENNDSFVIVDFDEFEAYYLACKLEKDGLRFYRRLDQVSLEEKIKQTIKLLIQEELNHLIFFEQQLALLRKEKEDFVEDNDLIANLNLGIFKLDENDINQFSDYNKIFTLAIKLEEKTILFYQQVQKNISTLLAQSALAKIIDEEKKHKRLLESLIYNRG